MPQGIYLPEGHLLENEQNRACLATEEVVFQNRAWRRRWSGARGCTST